MREDAAYQVDDEEDIDMSSDEEKHMLLSEKKGDVLNPEAERAVESLKQGKKLEINDLIDDEESVEEESPKK